MRKNLILRLVVPRFFVQGDEMVISALVHNYLTTQKTARISLDLKGLDILDGAPKDIDIPSRGEVKVDWRVRAQQVHSATVLGKALTDEESDAMELTLPINIPGRSSSPLQPRRLAQANAGDTTFDLTFTEKVVPRSPVRAPCLSACRPPSPVRSSEPLSVISPASLWLRGANHVELPAQHSSSPGYP